MLPKNHLTISLTIKYYFAFSHIKNEKRTCFDKSISIFVAVVLVIICTLVLSVNY